MAKSKAYLSFVILFASLISSHVLAQELRGTAPRTKFSVNCIWQGGSFKCHSTLGPEENPRPYNAKVDELGEPERCRTFPQASRKTMPGTRSIHYSHSPSYNPSNLKLTELKNYQDASVMKHHNMVRPSEIDWRAFHVFQAKTFETKNGGKTGYGGVPRMEDIGEETKN